MVGSAPGIRFGTGAAEVAARPDEDGADAPGALGGDASSVVGESTARTGWPVGGAGATTTGAGGPADVGARNTGPDVVAAAGAGAGAGAGARGALGAGPGTLAGGLTAAGAATDCTGSTDGAGVGVDGEPTGLGLTGAGPVAAVGVVGEVTSTGDGATGDWPGVTSTGAGVTPG